MGSCMCNAENVSLLCIKWMHDYYVWVMKWGKTVEFKKPKWNPIINLSFFVQYFERSPFLTINLTQRKCTHLMCVWRGWNIMLCAGL